MADETITTPPDRSPADQQPAWREDFPIDWPQDQYVERRDFMKFMVLTSGAFALGQLWIGLQNWWRKHSGETYDWGCQQPTLLNAKQPAENDSDEVREHDEPHSRRGFRYRN